MKGFEYKDKHDISGRVCTRKVFKHVSGFIFFIRMNTSWTLAQKFQGSVLLRILESYSLFKSSSKTEAMTISVVNFIIFKKLIWFKEIFKQEHFSRQQKEAEIFTNTLKKKRSCTLVDMQRLKQYNHTLLYLESNHTLLYLEHRLELVL